MIDEQPIDALVDEAAQEENTFDFEAHRREAVAEYLKNRAFYVELAHGIQTIVQQCLVHRKIKVHSVEYRAKDASSFEIKAGAPSIDDPTVPKYNDPARQITDLAGVRVITFFPATLDDIDDVLEEEFEIVERSDKGAVLLEQERFGYQSIHYLVKIRSQRADLPEYERFRDAIIEIQVRTILQHAWAEIEHDIQYKSPDVIPMEIRRRFMALAGLLELADREFQAIQNADVEITEKARASVEEGDLNVEITPSALKTYLDRRLGADGRIASFSYTWTARILRSLGFRSLEQVDRCIDGYDDDRISRIAQGYRQGQTTRFEHMLLAGMGKRFIERHPLCSNTWFSGSSMNILERLETAGIAIRDFDPSSTVTLT
jgi:ppGpp synthetase/RelA/SpoT-type nucleotidyltranferase